MGTVKSTGRLVLLAFGLSLVMAVELAAGNGFLKTMMAGALPWQSLVMVLVMVAVATGAIINAFTATMRPEPMRIAGTVASCALAMTAGLTASHSVAKLPQLFFFGASLLGHSVYAYCMMFLIVRCLKIGGRWATVPPYVAAGAVVLFGAIAFVAQSWMSMDTATEALALVRDLSLVAVPFGLLGAVALLRPLRLDPKSRMASLKLRLPLDPDGPLGRVGMRALAMTLIGLGVSAAWNLILHLGAGALGPAAGASSLTAFSFGWIGATYLCLSELAVFTGEQRQGNATAKLATTSAKRFLKRHLSDKQNWAATVGLKTTNFSIDHDPGSFLHTQLPASIMQIRGEEIQRCVNEVLGAMHLHSYVVGHRIFGAVDSEIAIRPCIDTLKMFACLYLDAGPLVERRIKGLTSLLPIVDPGLAKVLRPKDISTLMRRALWFFHFDFGWIDQHVIHSPRNTRYDVRMETLSSGVRHSLMEYLEKTGGVSNFVWLGPEARERLLQEAPAMKNIVEACPIPAGAGAPAGSDELLMFVVRFEQLIPRLQRYFDLDSMRKALLDFEPSQESARLLNLLGLQISKAKTGDEILEVLGSITSVPWRGFKEKDNALQLILSAYTKLGTLLAAGKSLQEADDPKTRALHDKLLDAVKAVGYPSQVLHHAQVNKIALRDVATLREVAGDPRHARFSEAWLLMATTDYSRHKPESRRELLAFLRDVRHSSKVAVQRLVQVKAVDALASLGRVCQEGDMQLLREVQAAFCHWFAETQVDLDICCLFLDANLFLASHLSRDLDLPGEALTRLDGYFRAMTVDLGANHPKVIAVMSRWQEFRTQAQKAPVQAA